ncbi:hypothetical protein PQX77_021627 [Marasmius sp. AFHP31]|nr:hypothetical protein PQX77_021627 [Marasmius sp. AFHP31]
MTPKGSDDSDSKSTVNLIFSESPDSFPEDLNSTTVTITLSTEHDDGSKPVYKVVTSTQTPSPLTTIAKVNDSGQGQETETGRIEYVHGDEDKYKFKYKILVNNTELVPKHLGMGTLKVKTGTGFVFSDGKTYVWREESHLIKKKTIELHPVNPEDDHGDDTSTRTLVKTGGTIATFHPDHKNPVLSVQHPTTTPTIEEILTTFFYVYLQLESGGRTRRNHDPDAEAFAVNGVGHGPCRLAMCNNSGSIDLIITSSHFYRDSGSETTTLSTKDIQNQQKPTYEVTTQSFQTNSDTNSSSPAIAGTVTTVTNLERHSEVGRIEYVGQSDSDNADPKVAVNCNGKDLKPKPVSVGTLKVKKGMSFVFSDGVTYVWREKKWKDQISLTQEDGSTDIATFYPTGHGDEKAPVLSIHDQSPTTTFTEEVITTFFYVDVYVYDHRHHNARSQGLKVHVNAFHILTFGGGPNTMSDIKTPPLIPDGFNA